MNTSLESFVSLLSETGHALLHDEVKVKDMFRMINNFEEKNKRPFYMYCSATGKRVGMSQQPVFEKRLAKFNGSLVSMFVNYVCRDGKRESAPPVVVAADQPSTEEASDDQIFISEDEMNEQTEKEMEELMGVPADLDQPEVNEEVVVVVAEDEVIEKPKRNRKKKVVEEFAVA